MDDVDGAQAQMSRNILQSGDWVTMQLDGVKNLEKPPLLYWMIAVSFRLFGAVDWAARLPNCLAAILLCWLVARMAGTAMGERAGFYAGLSLATSVGFWLFTRVLFHDIVLTLAVACAIWSFSRAIDDTAEVPDSRRRLWALASWAAVGAGILAKGLIAGVFPVGTALLYLAVSGRWKERRAWRHIYILPGIAVLLAVAAPWHILAILRNPPYFDFSLHSAPGQYRGFFWFYFLNEHLLRFLNLRYPHDYDAVPRPLFWLLHLAWFFPWSGFFFRTARLNFRGTGKAAQMRLLALCWAIVVLGFFTLSTRQEYYSMPGWPALAILIGSAMAETGDREWRWPLRAAGGVAVTALLGIAGILFLTRSYATPRDISAALTHNPGDYTLSMGHMADLTLRSFAYLRMPLVVAGIAMLAGALGGWVLRGKRAAVALAVMMILFFQAARLALVKFDPYLGSRPLAEALNRQPPGELIVDDPYFEMSSLFFYTNRTALILNGRVNNLEYGSYAPGARQIFIDNAGFVARWSGPSRWYVASEDDEAERLRKLVGAGALHEVASAGGKTIYCNR